MHGTSVVLRTAFKTLRQFLQMIIDQVVYAPSGLFIAERGTDLVGWPLCQVLHERVRPRIGALDADSERARRGL